MAPVSLIDQTPSAYGYPLLIKHLLHTPLANTPKQEIVYRELKRYDYETLGKRIGSLANLLAGLGVEPGNTVGVMDWDSHRYLECYFAVPMMGAILHTVNVRLSPEQILYTINHAEDDVLLVNIEFLPILEEIAKDFKTVKKIILLADCDSLPETKLEITGEYEQFLAKSPADYDFPDFDENAKATTFYTTGTTGLPKGVFFSHRQLVLHTLCTLGSVGSFPRGAGFNSGDVYMPITPMFHVHAWGIPYVSTLLGVKQVYPGRYSPDGLLGLIKKEKVTLSHCVPTILHMLLTSPAVSGVDLSNWKVIIGGSSLPKGLCKAALERGINVFTGYGMSETCPILTLATFKPNMTDLSPERDIEIRCRAGMAVPLVDLKVIDPEGNAQPHDGVSVGEVVVRAPWLTQGYFKETEKSEELWQGGYLHTQDIGFIDEEGYLQITDRIKDVIKTGGEWISSLQIEDILTQHEAVSEAAAFGTPDEKWGERPIAFVTLKENYLGKCSEDDLKNFFKQAVAGGVVSKWAMPDRIIITDRLPKTSVGKMDKKNLRKSYKP
ncbi:MAG: fatty acid--CoA ligase [Syntrophobacteraceae bacterium]